MTQPVLRPPPRSWLSARGPFSYPYDPQPISIFHSLPHFLPNCLWKTLASDLLEKLFWVTDSHPSGLASSAFSKLFLYWNSTVSVNRLYLYSRLSVHWATTLSLPEYPTTNWDSDSHRELSLNLCTENMVCAVQHCVTRDLVRNVEFQTLVQTCCLTVHFSITVWK